MKTIYYTLICSIFLLALNCTTEKQDTVKPVSLIFDTDMGPDYDDVGALTLLHALADSNEVKILATVSSNLDSLAGPCINVINTYYGRPELPIGAPKEGINMGDHWHKEMWTIALATKYPHALKKTASAPEAVQVYREILATQPDYSVVIVTVGFLTNLANLLESAPDKYSPLSGKQLITAKVKRLVSMAGGFPSGNEFNVRTDSIASLKVFSEWSTPITFSGFEIGDKIITGKRLIESDIAETPAKKAYSICLKQADFDGRMSWDQITTLIAVRGTEKYFDTARGRIVVNPDGSNTWQDTSNGNHEYLKWKMSKDDLTEIIEDLMMYERK